MDTSRLTEFYTSRIDQLNAVIAENHRGALAAHPRGTFGWAMQMLVANSMVRRLGRRIMAHLPDGVGRRIKSRVVCSSTDDLDVADGRAAEITNSPT